MRSQLAVIIIRILGRGHRLKAGWKAMKRGSTSRPSFDRGDRAERADRGVVTQPLPDATALGE